VIALHIIYWALLAAVLCGSLYLFFLALAALLPAKRAQGRVNELPFLSVLIPAHNEETLILDLLESLDAQDYPKDRYSVHVVADNCTDATAEIARVHGVKVYERMDTFRPGKGQALGWLLKQLGEQSTTDAFVFVDADSTVDPNFLSVMSGQLSDCRSLLQASYRVRDASSHALVGLRALAFALMHDLRGRGKTRLGLSCGLWGNGMAFSKDVVDLIAWEGLSAVEDAEQYLQLLLQGLKVRFVPAARVYGYMPSTFRSSRDQQRRWEGGKLYLIKRYTAALARQAIHTRSVVLAAALLELLILPLSLHVVLAVALSLWAFAGLGLAASIGSIVALTATGGYAVCGFATAQLPPRVYASLLYTPVYVAWKAWLFVGELPRRAEPPWLKTSRET